MYYVHDGLGSVRQLSGATGEVVETYAYDPFGVPLAEGSVPNPYRFTGETWDAEVELLYLRARYYQPATGRFVTRDPWPGDRLQPGSLNWYVYVQNNSVNYADPIGLEGRGPLCPECQEALPGYSVFEASYSAALLAQGWFYEWPWIKEKTRFGPEDPLTQAVMRSPALFQFRAEWARVGYPLHWTWLKQSLDEREKGPLPPRLVRGAKAYATQHLRLVLLGDPVGAILGSFNDITVEPSELSAGMVHIEAHNVMGWASASRVYGTTSHPIENVPRSALGPGGTIEQWFEWDEPMGMGCWIKAYKHLFGERFRPV